jgi:hypothetical protein
MAFLGAVFALGVFLGTAVAAPVAALRSSSHSSSHSSPLPPHPPLSAVGTNHSGTVSAKTAVLSTVDAPFGIVTLGVQCILDLCEGGQYVSSGQRIYAPQGGWSCIITNADGIVGHSERYIYCQLEQPSVFTSTFDGAQFDCVGSRLGCHFVLRVETTNGH